jgi:hypothetical protein
MPYPKPFCRLSYLFAIASTDEIAETGLHISTVGSSPFDADAFVAAATGAQLASRADDYETAMGATHLWWASYSELVGMKLAALTTGGVYSSAPLVETVSGHQGTTESVPPENSVCASLRSVETFGRANFGRMYLPHTGAQLGTGTPYMDATTTGNIVASLDTMLTAVNTWANGVSAGAGIVNISKVGAGAVKAVATVQVGRILDTQRRRRNRLDEHPYARAAL